jgi:hypothetical protein
MSSDQALLFDQLKHIAQLGQFHELVQQAPRDGCRPSPVRLY